MAGILEEIEEEDTEFKDNYSLLKDTLEELKKANIRDEENKKTIANLNSKMETMQSQISASNSKTKKEIFGVLAGAINEMKTIRLLLVVIFFALAGNILLTGLTRSTANETLTRVNITSHNIWALIKDGQ